jgi:catechol-2,3-dioxygenase
MHLKEILLVTGDLEHCRSFYGDILGLAVKNISATHISFEIGQSILSFKEIKNSQPLYHMAFSVPNNMLQPALDWINERATVLPYDEYTVIADFTGWNAKAFYFRDHDGNILECITHYDWADSSEGPFTKDCFKSIIEIGIPVDDVTIACENFNSQYGIPYFKKGPRLMDFSVMGNEDGMLIVTKKGRGWLPTQQAAEQHPMNVAIEINGNNVKLEFS